MPGGQAAQVRLARLVLNQEMVAVVHKLDRYGLTVATLWIGSNGINRTMVHDGMALHYKQFEPEQPMVQAFAHAQSERVARATARGLWCQDNPMESWSWRKSRARRVTT